MHGGSGHKSELGRSLNKRGNWQSCGEFPPLSTFPPKGALCVRTEQDSYGQTSRDDDVVVVVGADHDAVGGDDDAVGGDESHFLFHLLLCLPIFPILPLPSKNKKNTKFFRPQKKTRESFLLLKICFSYLKIQRENILEIFFRPPKIAKNISLLLKMFSAMQQSRKKHIFLFWRKELK